MLHLNERQHMEVLKLKRVLMQNVPFQINIHYYI